MRRALVLAVGCACCSDEAVRQADQLAELHARVERTSTRLVELDQQIAEVRADLERRLGELETAEAERQASERAAREASSLSPTPGPDPALSAETGVECDGERCTIEGARLEELLADPARLATQVRLVPSIQGDVVQGFKLFGIRKTSTAHALGLQNGDLLRSINGHALGDPDKASEAWEALRRASRFEIALDRRGVAKTLVVTRK